MIFSLLTLHLGVSTVTLLIWGFFFAPHKLPDVAAGAGLMGINLAVLVWAWQKIFYKKSVALASLAIVFKYAILGAIIYFVIVGERLDSIAFTVGLATIAPTMIAFSLVTRKTRT